MYRVYIELENTANSVIENKCLHGKAGAKAHFSDSCVSI